MPLGIDATTRFAVGNYTTPLTESQLDSPSPYNTRLTAGLPPGPIGNPGLAAIEAAAHPAKVDYLFYVVKPGTCGEHNFSSNEAQFARDQAAYQQAAGGEGRLPDHLSRMMRRLAVLGMPIDFSRSPAIHNAAFAALGMDGEWSYEAIEVAPNEFEERVRAMPGEGFVGANVTVPHKGAAVLLSDRRSDVAREIGAANTLIFEDGEIRADNTDAEGLMESLPASAAGRRALVLGAGGAARAAVWALIREGAEVSVWNRTPERAAAALRRARRPGRVRSIGQADYELIVNSTSVGLHGEDPFAELPLSRDWFGFSQTVVDLVYGHGESKLLQVAGEAGRRRRRRARGAGPPGRGLVSDLDRRRPADRRDARGGQGRLTLSMSVQTGALLAFLRWQICVSSTQPRPISKWPIRHLGRRSPA